MTSVSLEAAFWDGLKEIAKTKRKTLSDLVDGIDTSRDHANLSSAIRLFVLNYYQTRDRPVVLTPVDPARADGHAPPGG
jgi:predicted DNA-binding ribbon-helix-helix protein